MRGNVQLGLRENLSFRWIFWSFSYKNYRTLVKKWTFFMKLLTIFAFFQPWSHMLLWILICLNWRHVCIYGNLLSLHAHSSKFKFSINDKVWVKSDTLPGIRAEKKSHFLKLTCVIVLSYYHANNILQGCLSYNRAITLLLRQGKC